MNENRFDHLKKLARLASEKAKQQLDLGAASTTVKLGNLYQFTLDLPIDLEWLVVLTNKDDPQLWYIIPVDQNPLVGPEDIELPKEQACGPIVLRCDHGLWAHSNDFAKARCVGIISEDCVDDARDRLPLRREAMTLIQIIRYQMFRFWRVFYHREWFRIFANPSVIRQFEFSPEYFEQDLDYEEWIETVSAATDQLEQHLHSQRLSKQQKNQLHLPKPQLSDLVLSAGYTAGIGAALGGLVGLVAGLLGRKDTAAFHLIESDAPGDLFAFEEGNGASLIYLSKGDEQPPCTHDINEVDNPKQLDWKQDPSGKYFHSFPILAWQNDQVAVDITGSGPVTIKRNA